MKIIKVLISNLADPFPIRMLPTNLLSGKQEQKFVRPVNSWDDRRAQK